MFQIKNIRMFFNLCAYFYFITCDYHKLKGQNWVFLGENQLIMMHTKCDNPRHF